MARVALTKRAVEDLEMLPFLLGDAAAEAIAELAYTPDKGHKLRGRLAGVRSLRVGAYRILYHLVDNDKTVRILAVRHRSVAYQQDPR